MSNSSSKQTNPDTGRYPSLPMIPSSLDPRQLYFLAYNEPEHIGLKDLVVDRADCADHSRTDQVPTPEILNALDSRNLFEILMAVPVGLIAQSEPIAATTAMTRYTSAAEAPMSTWCIVLERVYVRLELGGQLGGQLGRSHDYEVWWGMCG